MKIHKIIITSLALTSFLLSGCGSDSPRSEGSVSVGLSFIPIRININSNGVVSANISSGFNLSIVNIEFGASVSLSDLDEQYPNKRLLVVRVDGEDTVYSLETGKSFEIEYSADNLLFREVRFEKEADDDILLELSSIDIQTLIPPSPTPILPSGEITDVNVDYEVFEEDEEGMRIHVDVTVTNLKGIRCRVLVFFYDESGRLEAHESDFRTSDGYVMASKNFTPDSDYYSNYDFELFLPYRTLPPESGEYELKFEVKLYEYRGETYLAESGFYPFRWTKQELPDLPSSLPSEPPSLLIPNVTIQDIFQEHDIMNDFQNGMNIVTNFSLTNADGATCLISALFYDQFGQPLRDFDGQYGNADGQVATVSSLIPYDGLTSWTTTHFIPYSQFHLAPGVQQLQFVVTIICRDPYVYVQSLFYPFTVRW